MQIKYLTKTHTIEIKDLEKDTIGSLRKKIKEIVKECSDLPDEKILLFHNKTKVSASEETKLGDVQINNESTVFVVLIKTDHQTSHQAKAPNPSATHTPNQDFHNSFNGFPNPASGNMFNNFQQQGTPSMGEMGFEQQLIDQMLKDPDAMLSMLESQMPSLTDDQKAMLKQNIELMKKNPEMVKQMLNNPAVQNAIRNPAMAGNPMMMGNPYMQQNPMTSPYMGGNPYMASPYMGGNPYMSPNPMMNPMMNNGYYNPYAMQLQMNSPAPPANGPCSHGFYPPRMVNDKPEPQDAEKVYAEKLNALNEMGFYDKEANIKALIQAKGDISEAIDILSKKMNGNQ